MRSPRLAFLGRAFASLSILAALAVVPIGCGEPTKETDHAAGPPPEIQKANSNMQDFMKNQPKK